MRKVGDEINLGDFVLWDDWDDRFPVLVTRTEVGEGIGLTFLGKVYWARGVTLEILQGPEEWTG